MPWQAFNFVGGYGRSRQGGISPSRTINAYITETQNDAAPPALIGTPGVQVRDIVENLRGRGGLKLGNVIYAVIGDTFYQINATVSLNSIAVVNSISLGTLLTAAGYVELSANNGNQIMIVDGGNGYIYNTSTGVFELIDDPDFPLNPTTVCFMDGYFVTNSFGTRQWNLSNLNDGTMWDALQAQNMSYGQDTVQCLRVLKGNLWVMGSNTIETWANPGTVTPFFPLVQNTNLRFQSGIAAPASAVQGLDTLTWLANNAQGTASVMFSNGGEPIPISDLYVNQAIQNYIQPGDGMGYLFRENGHDFYALNFTTENKSWLYDFTTQYWTEQQMLEGDRHLLSWVGSISNINIGIGWNDGNIYQLQQNFYKNAGEAIHRRRVTDRFKADTLQEIKINALMLDMETGLCPPGTDPKIFLSVSIDAGKNFGPSIELQMGRIGNYINQIQALNLGIARDFTFAIDFYEDFDFVLRDAAINSEVVGA